MPHRFSMANILLTNRCVRSCPYCFAEKEMRHSMSKSVMSWEDIIYLADFLQASGEGRVSLLGGEPTLHPEFTDILLYFMDRGLSVTVFTSGIMSHAVLNRINKHISGNPDRRVTFVCNLNNPEQTDALEEEKEKIRNFLSALGKWTMAGFNIYRTDFELGFLFDMIGRYGLKKSLRLGIAHPIPGSDNRFIRVGEIKAIIERIYSYKSDFQKSGISPHFDCGFPLCRVTDEQLGWFARNAGHVSFKCLPAIDITPDMQVYCCFPLSHLKRKTIFDFNSFKEITDYYAKLQDRIRRVLPGIYEECHDCVHRHGGRCAGGGVCQLLKKLADESPEILSFIANELDETCCSL